MMTQRLSPRHSPVLLFTLLAVAAVLIGLTAVAAIARSRFQDDDLPEPVLPAEEPLPPSEATAPPEAALPPPEPAPGVWMPPLQTSWQWQLTQPVDQSVNVVMFDVDLFETDAQVVASLRAKGRKVICYVSVGAWENWRPDASRFPDAVKGKQNGWPGERWLDIRRLDILAPLLEARLDLCKAKGFDGVEPDNVDGHIADTGFPLSFQDQLRFNVFIANAAHRRGLSVGLKNDLPQVQQLLPYFDWAMNEECFERGRCELLIPFIEAGKAVFHVEYALNSREFCPRANAMNFNSLKKRLDLDAYREACR